MQQTTDVVKQVRTVGTARAAATAVAVSAEALEGIPYGRPFAQQGDIYIAKVARVPDPAQRIAGEGQLAPGTSQGSRHCVDPARVQLYRRAQPTTLEGPIIEAPHAFTITHPEHGHITLPPGVYGVTYQRAYADVLRRVVD